MRTITQICLSFFLLLSCMFIVVFKIYLDRISRKLCQKYDWYFVAHFLASSSHLNSDRVCLKSDGERECRCKRKISKDISNFGEESTLPKNLSGESMFTLPLSSFSSLRFRWVFFLLSFYFFLVLIRTLLDVYLLDFTGWFPEPSLREISLGFYSQVSF